MLDGPQGLARVGKKIRTCERILAAAGKTADVRPPISQPYGGFIASSLDLFTALHAAEVFVVPGRSTPLREVYPAAIWTRLARRLPNKRRAAGRRARAAILKALGVALPETAVSVLSRLRSRVRRRTLRRHWRLQSRWPAKRARPHHAGVEPRVLLGWPHNDAQGASAPSDRGSERNGFAARRGQRAGGGGCDRSVVRARDLRAINSCLAMPHTTATSTETRPH